MPVFTGMTGEAAPYAPLDCFAPLAMTIQPERIMLYPVGSSLSRSATGSLRVTS